MSLIKAVSTDYTMHKTLLLQYLQLTFLVLLSFFLTDSFLLFWTFFLEAFVSLKYQMWLFLNCFLKDYVRGV